MSRRELNGWAMQLSKWAGYKIRVSAGSASTDATRLHLLACVLFLLALHLPSRLIAQDVGTLRQDVTFESQILKRKIAASVYLPGNYGSQTSKLERFPVVYLLHGLGDDHTAWPRLGKIKSTLDPERRMNPGSLGLD